MFFLREGIFKMVKGITLLLEKDIFPWLPLDSLCIFSVVCSEYNALFFSTKFITNWWVKVIPNLNPLLLFSSVVRIPNFHRWVIVSSCEHGRQLFPLTFCNYWNTQTQTFNLDTTNALTSSWWVLVIYWAPPRMVSAILLFEICYV